MKICILVATPDRPLLFVQQPVESLYAAAVLGEAGHQVEVVDTRVSAIETQLTDRPDLFFLITQTYDLTQCNSISLDNSRLTVANVRERHPGVPIVAAGMHASLETEMTKRDLAVDAALPGEVEVAIPWLVEKFQEDPRVLETTLDEAPRQADPAALPVPDYDLVDLHKYWGEVIDLADGGLRADTTGLIFANRGCPYECSYCFVWFGAKIRRREPSQVVAELRAQYERGVKNFFFLDYTFTIIPAWVRELCGLIREENLDISWICQTRVERVTPELLADMHSAGCNGVFYGVESPWIADLDLEKPTSRATIEKAINDTNNAGIRALIFILFGTENGDHDKAQELHDFLRDLPAIFHPSVLLPRPFTSLWKRHTEGMRKPASWAEYDRISTELQDVIVQAPEVTDVHERILLLPNYVENYMKRAGSA